MDLTDDISAYVTRIERLEADLTRERAISAHLATLKPEDIPAPDSFDGNRANLHPFLTKLRMKIAVMPPNFQISSNTSYSTLSDS